MVRFLLPILALMVVILALAARRDALHDLQVANESLRRKIAAAPPPALPPPDNPQTEAAQLSPAERAELLRLRGQILPLHQEIRDLSNRVERATALASAAQTRTAPAKTEPREISQQQRARMEAMQAFVNSEPVQALYRKAGLAGQKLQKYLRENNHELPQDRSVLDGLPEEFELMRSGSVNEEDEGRTLVARQKEPLPTPDGRMMRVYVHANGTALLATLPANGDWAGWEQRAEDRAMRRSPGKAP